MSDSISRTILTGDSAILANRYAEALYDLAEADKQLDVVADELRGLKKIIAENDDMRSILHNPRLSRNAAVAFMKQISVAISLSKLTGNFLGLISKNRRLGLLNGMANAFLAKLAAARNEFSVEVTAAKPLTPAQEQDLIAQMEKVTGGKVQLDVRLVPSLLGGLIVKLGSRQIDASLRGKLARLERQLKTQREAA